MMSHLRPRTIHLAYLALEAPREGQASYAHVFEIVEGLRRRALSVDLYLPRYTYTEGTPRLARRMWEYARLQCILAARCRRYDLIYVRSHFMAFPLALIARLSGKPILHEVNGPHLDILISYPWTRRFKTALEWLQRTQYRWADALIAVTPQLQSWLRSEGCENPIEVIPNGANLALFNPKRQRREGLPARYVVFFGGFARWQGIPTMIAATHDPAWPEGVSLVVVGGGQLKNIVEEAASKCDRICYLGSLPYAEVGGIVAGALAGLVPKTREADSNRTGLFPIKLFEILACGTPAIVSNYPGQADLVLAGHCGIVIPPENPSALAQAVAHISVNEAGRAAMGARGHDLIAKEHSWDQRSEQTVRLIRTTLQRRPVEAQSRDLGGKLK